MPFAGGNAYSYRDLDAHVADVIELAPVEPPGRGRRFSETLLTSLQAMADDLFAQIREELEGPYAFYGHSMGGRLGYLVTRRILTAGLPAPLHLFVSGCAGPGVARNRRRYTLPIGDFVSMLKRMGCPPDVLENDELMEVFEPVLRADFKANDTYTYERQPPFEVPITAIIGTQEETTPEEALEWQRETKQELTLTHFPGGHFFIFDHLPELGHLLSRTLSTALSDACRGSSP
jgi:surfactin synthase thioesterase subunit